MADTVVGLLLTSVLACLAFFLNRLITQYDSFRRSTKNELQKLSSDLYDIKSNTETGNNLNKKIIDSMPKVAVPRYSPANNSKEIEEINKKITSIGREISNEIKPLLYEAKKNHGKIIWIKDNMEAQDKKLVGLFQVIKAMVKDSQKPR